MSDTPQEPPRVAKWKRVEGPAAEITFTHPETGERIGPIMVPYEEGNPPSEEEAYAQARDYYNRLEHIRDNLKEETIEAVATDLRTGGYGKWMARELRTIFHSGVKIATKPSDDATPEEIAEDEATAAEMNALLRDKSDTLADALLEASPRWREFAIDALSQSWAQALNDLLEEHPDASSWPDDRFHPALKTRYEEGDYFTGAMLNAGNTWLEIIARDIAGGLESSNGEMGPLAEILEQKARDRIRKRQLQLPMMTPPFQQGWGTAPSVALMRGALRRLMAPWPGDRSAWPEARFSWGGKASGYLLFTLHENPAGASETERQAAWEYVDKLSDWTAVTLATVAAMYRANRGHHGRLIVETNDLLRAWKRGTKKGYKAADKDAVNEALYVLSRIVIYRLEYDHVPQGKRSRQRHRNTQDEHGRDHSGVYPLLWLAERKRNGRNITWDIQLGPDLLQMAEHFPRQYASIVAGSLGINGKRPHPGRLDRILPLEARAQPAVFTQHGIPIRDLLELAGVDADSIARQDRSWWKKQLSGILNDCASIEHWDFKHPPGDRWPDWLATPVLIHVKRPAHDPDAKAELEVEEGTTPTPGTIAPGWLT